MAGNLSHQIEHHLFPDIPAHRYGEIAVEVSELCARFGIPYNTGPLGKQFGSVVKKICRLALPDRLRGVTPAQPAEAFSEPPMSEPLPVAA
jgi:fatty acid desaturase